MSAQSSGHTPRSSTSSHPSASSAVLQKSQNGAESDLWNGSEVPHGAEVGGRVYKAEQKRRSRNVDGEEHEDRQQRRQRPRTSGGFLLQNSLLSQVLERPSDTITEASDIVKGKRRVEPDNFVIPKRTPSQSIASESKARRDESEDGPTIENQRHRPFLSNGNKNSSNPQSSIGTNEWGYRRSLLGQNTDPATIVNLALSLSESRRRNLSGATTFMSNDAVGGRRKISGIPQTFGIPYGTSGGSLRQHLQEQRHMSRNFSPRVDGLYSRRAEDSSVVQEERQFLGSQPREKNSEDVVFNASDATLARAEKARIALELGYEYRRLLRYLPPIPRRNLSTDKGAEGASAHNSLSSGRAYNPLQYIRNRKVRFREKKPLNPESDGWKDVGRVRTWVDTVKSQNEAEGSSTDGSFLLPPFEAVADQPTVVDSTDNSSPAQAKNVPPTTRPKLDWIFAASDLLADIYWLHRDQNIERIEDRSWQKINQSPLSYKTGQLRMGKESPISPASGKSAKSLKLETSPKQTRSSAVNGNLDLHERGRLRKGHRHLAPSIDVDNESRPRKSRWPKKLLGSRSSSSGSQSDSSGQSHQHRSLRIRDGFDNAALEKHMMDIIKREAEESRQPLDAMNGNPEGPDVKPAVSAKANEDSNMHEESGGLQPSKTAMADNSGQATSKVHNLNNEGQNRRLSSEDTFTAPTSPIIPGLAPSIAVDLSPPQSPQSHAPTSTTFPSKRPLASRFGSFRRDRSRSVGRQPINDSDALVDSASSRLRPGEGSHESEPHHLLTKDRSPPPPEGSLAPPKIDSSNSITRVQDLRHSRKAKDINNPESRRRGFFKGGRIAELVGNEVSKVGEIFWRKDAGTHVSQLAIPPASNQDSDASDDDDNGTSIVESNPSDSLSRITTNNSGIVMKSSGAAGDQQKYYMNNLPSFRSQAADNDQSSKLTASVPSDDHIARQQRMMKERGRSFKFDRLAPPRIDMRSVSPSPSSLISRSQSQEPANDQSRGSSGSRSSRGARIADQRLNDMLGIPGRIETGKIAPTGLAAFSSSSHDQRDHGRPNIKRQWSISDRGIAAVNGTITKRDIARVRALLLSSGVKANEIVRRNDEVPTEPLPLLQDLQDFIEDPLPLIPASQEVTFAARSLVTDIENTHQQLRDGAESFSTETVDRLHNQIKAIDDQVNYKLTPLVRAAADDADAFNTELTTAHTLAVRQLNLSVDLIFRRRRRRLRWIARGGWAILEWIVLGVMWAVWFIVVIVRIVRGTINGVVVTLRWLLFL